MSLNHIFNEGDVVTLIPLFKSKGDVRYVLKLEKNGVFQCRHGVIKHNDIIGKMPGTVIRTHLGYSFVVLQALLPDMIKNYREFKYVTQVIYPRDWGLIVAFSDIKVGDIIVEIGTGSGALLAFLAYRVGEKGWIYSYERDPERAKKALENIKNMKVPQRYTIKIKDVAESGIDERNVDVIFIDIPEPWTVIKHCWCALKPGGRIIVYVPTYNQVEKVLRELMYQGFIDISIREGFIREIQIKPYAIRPKLKGYYFSAFIIFARKSMIIPLQYIFELKKRIFTT